MTAGLIELMLGIWSMVTMVKCVGEAHNFSACAALGALILPILIIVIPLLLILLPVLWMRH